MAERNLIILDVDKTLVYTLDSDQTIDGAEPDFEISRGRGVLKRPGLDALLNECLERYRVAVWSQSELRYVQEVLQGLVGDPDVFEFVWGFERCTFVTNPWMRQFYWVKDLRKVRRRGYRLERVLAVDDTARKYERSYGNLIRIRRFAGEQDDRELFRLRNYLRTFADLSDVRPVEKRWWHEHTDDSDGS